MSEPPEKPRPKRSAKQVATLRQEVRAKDKFAAVAKPEAEAVRLIADEYKTDDASALAFVQWLKGPASGASPEKPASSAPMETWHFQGDLVEGTEKLLPDSASATIRDKAKNAPKKKR